MKFQQLIAGLLGGFSVLLCAQEMPPASDLIKTAAPGTVFTEKSELSFSLRKEGYLPARYTVLDWRGNRVDSGLWSSGELVLRKKLPRGYYNLRLDTPKLKGERSFIIVADPEKRAGVVNDFYALDSGQEEYHQISRLLPHIHEGHSRKHRLLAGEHIHGLKAQALYGVDHQPYPLFAAEGPQGLKVGLVAV